MPAAKPPTRTANPARAQVRAYFAATAPAARKRLTELRAAIKAAAPRAVESFSYRIPGFRLDDRALVWYAAFAQHVSIYPIGRDFEQANAAALKGYATSGKGTLRFSLEKPIPKALVKRVVLYRIAKTKVKPRKK